jgi:hypothetical protein
MRKCSRRAQSLLPRTENRKLRPARNGLGSTETVPSLPSGSQRSATCWSSREASRILLRLLVRAFVLEGPLVLGIEETLERWWGKKIRAKGVYRYLRCALATIAL